MPFIQQLAIIFASIQGSWSWFIIIILSIIVGVTGFKSEPLIKPSTEKWQKLVGNIVYLEYLGKENHDTTYKALIEYKYNDINHKKIAYYTPNYGTAYRKNSAVVLYINPNNPNQVIVEGMRNYRFSAYIVLILTLFFIIPLLIFIITKMIKQLKLRYLLLNGILTHAKYLKKIPPTVYSKGSHAYEYEYEQQKYTAYLTIYYKRFDTTNAAEEELLEHESVNPQELLLVNPKNPEKHIILRKLPIKYNIDPQGNFVLSSMNYAYLVLPTIGILLISTLIVPIWLFLLGF